MKRLPFSLGLAVVAICLGCSRCLACDPLPSVASVLAKWEEASEKVKTLDAKLTIWKYDRVFGDGQPTITQGRLYYEAPNLARYEIRKNAKGATNDWSSVSEAIIWTGKETLWIEGDTRSCRKFSTAELRSVLSEPEKNDLGWWPVLGRALARRFQGPKQLLPLLIGIPASEVRERFYVTIEESGEEIHLRALPKRAAETGCYSRIDVILNAKTYMTVAIQVVSPNGRDRTVYQLSDTNVNVRPSDRDQLLFPDLSELRVDKIESPHSRSEKRVGLATESRTSMRPLGSHLMVDDHGVIWDGARPVGTWDVNGDNGH